MLEQELKYFIENRTDWISRYPNKFVLIKGAELVGTFDTLDEALAEGARRFGLESFLARRVDQDEREVNIPALTLGILRANSSHPNQRSGSNS